MKKTISTHKKPPVHRKSSATVQQSSQRGRVRKKAWAKCSKLAKSSNILHILEAELSLVRLVGEARNAKILFLALITRLFLRPVAIAVKGESSGGKSFLVRCVLKFFPTSAWLELTAMSDRGLVYSQDSLKHRFLVIFEYEGLKGELANYFVRSLLSEGYIRYQTVRGGRPLILECEGPTGLIITTTQTQVHAENETRLLSLNVGDTSEQTKAVMLERSRGNKSRKLESEKWHALQTWLSLKSSTVSIPFGEDIVDLMPSDVNRLRRDIDTVLDLVRAHALLHQASRMRSQKTGDVIATLTDYKAVRALIADPLAKGIEATVPTEIRETVEAVCTLLLTNPRGVSLGLLAKHVGLHKATLSRRVRRAKDAGYLRDEAATKGRPAMLVINKSMPVGLRVLPKTSKVEAHYKARRKKQKPVPPEKLKRYR